MGEKKTDESKGRIDWDTAEVKGGTLTVALDGDVSKAWSARVADVVERIDRSGTTGEMKVTRSKIEVTGVAKGGEDDVRFLLEGAVQQVNADFEPEPDDGAGDDGLSGEDAEMTAAFRSFAEPAPGDDD